MSRNNFCITVNETLTETRPLFVVAGWETADQPLGSDRFVFSSSRKFAPDTGHETMTSAFERAMLREGT
jgi:hypothetical protein